jgi:membrane-bound serine protease (ClpP class)
MKIKRVLTGLLLGLLILAFLPAGKTSVVAQSDQPVVVSLQLDGPLTPVWGTYLDRGIAQAETLGAELIVLSLNTPGGSIDLMNTFVQKILASPVPVAVYVSPQGAMAASAGTLIVLSGNLAAMSPASTIGAASPVGSQGEDIPTTEAAKIKEILRASARSMAERRGTEAVSLAEETIENAKAASAQEALDAGLVDLIAVDVNDLLAQLNGQEVTVGQSVRTLELTNARMVAVEPTVVEDVLGLLSNPNIVFVLLSLGVQALLIELSSPGGWVAGFFGAVLLSLSIYGLGILPVNWFGIVFMVISLVLFILDIKAPTHGALTIAGTGSFIAGALVLFNSSKVPVTSNVSVPLVIGMGLLMGASFFAVVMIAVKAMKTPVVTGQESMAGRAGIAVTNIDPVGTVQVAGEQWSARLEDGAAQIKAGDRISVTRTDGVRMVVKPFLE